MMGGRSRRPGLHFPVLVAVAALLAPTTSTAGADPALAVEAGGMTSPPPLVEPGDLVEDVGISVKVPPAGRGVWAEALSANGATQVVAVESLPGNIVVIRAWGEDRNTVGGQTISPGPCVDGAYVLAPWRWTSPFAWSYDVASRPPRLGEAGTTAAVRRGVDNVALARDGCGLPIAAPAEAVYLGPAAGTQIGNDGRCAALGDGRSVVQFGSLPTGKLGVACVWYNTLTSEAVEGDIRLNKAGYRWVTQVRPRCRNRWSIEGVMTHEAGHVFGLDHVSEEAHGNLTMSPRINGPCQTSEASLGLGDARGLDARYG